LFAEVIDGQSVPSFLDYQTKKKKKIPPPQKKKGFLGGAGQCDFFLSLGDLDDVYFTPF